MEAPSSQHLATLEGLLSISIADLEPALIQASDLVAKALGADKVDVFLYDAERNTLVAVGSSRQPLSSLQKKHGLDVLPVSNGGRTVEVYATGTTFLSGHTESDPDEVKGVKETLRVRSQIGVPVDVAGTRRGVLLVASAQPEVWGEADARFTESVGRWVSAVVHQAELVQQIQKSAVEAGRRSVAEELVTIVAHDLRNFVYPVDLMLQLLQRRAVRDARADDVRDSGRARQGLARLNALIGEILDVARIEQGALAIEPRPTALTPMVEDIAAVLGTPERPIVVETRDEVVALCDPARIRQCIENMVANALKYSPELVPTRLFVSRFTTDKGLEGRIEVVDQGPGIAPDILPFVFDRFVTKTTTSNRGGLGLGLFLARQIALLHGGSVSVQSVPGQGAHFTLALPAMDTDAASP